MRELADDVASVPQAAVIAVDPGRRVLLRGGGALRYDTLVLAPGARRLPAFDDALHIGDERTRVLETLREEILAGAVRSVAFVAPTLTGWLLPLYEAALLTARLGARVSLHHRRGDAARDVRRARGRRARSPTPASSSSAAAGPGAPRAAKPTGSCHCR